MQAKIFSGSGTTGIQEVEYRVNAWLAERGPDIRISDQQTTMCTVAESGAGEQSPYVVITIWYVERGGREQGER